MKSVKKKLKTDITISFGQSCNLVNVLSKRDDKVYVGIRSYDWLFQYIFHYYVDKFVYKKADAVVSVSQLIKRDAENIFNFNKDKSYFLYNPYDLELINNKSKEKITEIEVPTDKKIIVTVGRLEDQKGLYHLIKAISMLKNKDNVVVYILGHGTKKELLENLIKAYQLQNVIFLLGGQSNPYKYMSRADLYVMPSITEGFPNALVEAMSTETAVLCADCKSGPREILSNRALDTICENIEYAESGILVCPMTDSRNYSPQYEECDKNLANAIEELIENDNLRNKYAKAAKKRAELYSYDAFEHNLLQIMKTFN
ncbi:TPA: glycosyltransferase [Enterococcus faecium]|nr:glycosyltransferase [Enterococcus faecium]